MCSSVDAPSYQLVYDIWYLALALGHRLLVIASKNRRVYESEPRSVTAGILKHIRPSWSGIDFQIVSIETDPNVFWNKMKTMYVTFYYLTFFIQ